MITRLFSAALRGVDAQEVEVEVNARGGEEPIVVIVGMSLLLRMLGTERGYSFL